MNPKHKSSYLGRSAHLAVMAELAARGYRVSIPEIDVGTDVLAFLDTRPDVTSLQVKSTECKQLKSQGNFSGQINVPLTQLTVGGNLYYVFVFGLDGKWVDHLIISRESLNELRLNQGIGTPFNNRGKKYVAFRFTFRDRSGKPAVECGSVSFQ